MNVHTDRPSKFLFGCLIVVLCWIIGAGQWLNRLNDSLDQSSYLSALQQATTADDIAVISAPAQASLDHSKLALYCFLASILVWVVSVVCRQLAGVSRNSAATDSTSRPVDYPVWNIFDTFVSLIILSSAGVILAQTLGGHFALLICVTAIVCYFLAYGPQKIADYCRSIVHWLDQRHAASMVNGDLPLGRVGWHYDTRIILPESWWHNLRASRRVRVTPIGLILFGIGVMVTFGLVALFDNTNDASGVTMRPNRPPTLLSIPNSRVHADATDATDQPFKPEPAPIPMQRAEEPLTEMAPAPATAPELLPLNDKTVKEGELLHVMAQVRNASLFDGRLQFQLGNDAPQGASIDASSGLFSWRPTMAGTYDIAVAAVMDSSATAQAETTFRVIVTAQHRPPVISGIDDRSVNEGEPIVVPVMLKSPGYPQAALRFRLDSDAPDDAVIDPDSGVFSWTPGRPGTYPIVVHCESIASSNLSDQTGFTIVVNEVNEPPQLAEIGNKIVRAGESLIVPVKVLNPGRPAGQLHFAVTADSLPGIRIDPRTGVIQCEVDSDESAGQYPITVQLRNAARPALTDQISFHITVLEVAQASQSEVQAPGALEIMPINDHTVNAGSLLRFFIRPVSTGSPAGELDFSLAEEAPAGASINSRTGLFTWRPADDQANRQYWMTVRARDVENSTRHCEARFSVKVNRVEQDAPDEPVRLPQPANSFGTQHNTPEPEPVIPQFINPTPTQPASPKEPEMEDAPPLLPSPLEEPEITRQVLPTEDTSEGFATSVFINSIGIQLVPLPEGVFQMGSSESVEEMAPLNAAELLRFKDELPQHPVRLTRPFFMGKFEVTVGQFRQFVEQSGYVTEAERKGAGAYAFNTNTHEFDWGKQFNWRNTGWNQTIDHPVVNVSWNDATAFCQWLSEHEGRTYRLPTEAEWEYACRAGSETRYSSGDAIEDLTLAANLGDESFRQIVRPGYANVVLVAGQEGPAFTTPVGKFAPNAFGLHDMHGNVFEWCKDSYAATYYQESPLADPTGPMGGVKQVIRGGSFFNSPFYSRSSFRNGFAPNARVPYLGFRVVMEQDESTPADSSPPPQPMEDSNSTL